MIKRTFAPICLFILHFSILSQEPVTVEWAVRYNSNVNGNDRAYDMTVQTISSGGNVFVTGTNSESENHDFVTLKYSSSGIQLWTATYNGTANNQDIAKKIIVDDYSNIYVSGDSYGNGTGSDIVTIKYNSSGDQQWVARYSGTGNGQDHVVSTGADNTGNVYVAGEIYSYTTGYDYIIIKYNSSGVLQWTATYNGNANYGDYPASLILDSLGNIYITGYSLWNGTNYDYVTIKYNNAGEQQWLVKYSGTQTGDDIAQSIKTDAAGNVYVTGYSDGNGTNKDYATIKYNNAGVQQWAARYNGTGNSTDLALSLIYDDSGNVYVTGESLGNGTGIDLVTIKYNSMGIQQWVTRYNNEWNLNDAAVDIKGESTSKGYNIYVAGYSRNIATNEDYVVIKYNSAGVQQWIQFYDGTANSHDYITSLIVKENNVYVTGMSVGNFSSWDIASIKYSQPIGIKRLSDITPREYSLKQNYPNPFNTKTNFKLQIPYSKFVRFVIYNSLGQEVQKLVNEELDPGTYEVEWNTADKYSSGYYYYSLITDNFRNTKKMILIK